MMNQNPIDPGYPSPRPRIPQGAKVAIFVISALVVGSIIAKLAF